MAKFLIIGLGNVGNEYADTRHNIGFDVVNAFVMKHNGQFRVDRLAYVSEVKWKGHVFVCICPTTYMNLSGRAVKYWLDKEKVPLDHSLTIVDELSLPLDKLRLRGSGSAGGHNGLKDIEQVLGTQNYPRLRFGIGHQYQKGRQIDFVIGKWKPEEIEQVKYKIEKSVEIIESFASIGIDRTMSEYNHLSYNASKK